MAEIKGKILRPATTSNFQCWFPPPDRVRAWLREKKSAIDFTYDLETQELISLNCTDATLPGSSFATMDITDDYTGVTDRLSYRRQYDDRADFTFTIDNSVDNKPGPNYRVLLFFELWMQFIANEQYDTINDSNYFYRMNYPDYYQAPYIIINKFEKDFSGNCLQYKFLQAHPLSINSVPISYDSTRLLQYTVSFTYTRYVTSTFKLSGLPTPNTAALPSGIGPPPPPTNIPR